MGDKIADDRPSRADNIVPDISEKAMDSEKQALRTEDADAALEFLYSEGTTIMTDIDEKRLVRKVDWRIVPLMCRSSGVKQIVACYSANKKCQKISGACYNLQYLDKTLVNYANVM